MNFTNSNNFTNSTNSTTPLDPDFSSGFGLWWILYWCTTLILMCFGLSEAWSDYQNRSSQFFIALMIPSLLIPGLLLGLWLNLGSPFDLILFIYGLSWGLGFWFCSCRLSPSSEVRPTAS